LKGVTDDDQRDAAAAGWQLSSRSSRRAGTKRRRVIKSGADDMLELEGAEEDENEEGDLPGRGHHRGQRSVREWWFTPSRSPGNGHRQQKPGSLVFPFLHSIRWHACCGLLTAAPGVMLRCYGERLKNDTAKRCDELIKFIYH
jgi:hypothetical protein